MDVAVCQQVALFFISGEGPVRDDPDCVTSFGGACTDAAEVAACGCSVGDSCTALLPDNSQCQHQTCTTRVGRSMPSQRNTLCTSLPAVSPIQRWYSCRRQASSARAASSASLASAGAVGPLDRRSAGFSYDW